MVRRKIPDVLGLRQFSWAGISHVESCCCLTQVCWPAGNMEANTEETSNVLQGTCFVWIFFRLQGRQRAFYSTNEESTEGWTTFQAQRLQGNLHLQNSHADILILSVKASLIFHMVHDFEEEWQPSPKFTILTIQCIVLFSFICPPALGRERHLPPLKFGVLKELLLNSNSQSFLLKAMVSFETHFLQKFLKLLIFILGQFHVSITALMTYFSTTLFFCSLKPILLFLNLKTTTFRLSGTIEG